MMMINDPVILKLDYVSLAKENSYAGENRREFYKKTEIDSSRNSPRKLRSGRTGQRICGVSLEKQRKIRLVVSKIQLESIKKERTLH